MKNNPLLTPINNRDSTNMNKLILIIGVVVLCTATLISWGYSQSSSIRIVTQDWAPYNYVEDNELRGFSVEIVREIMQKLQIQNEIEIYPRKRSQIVRENGQNIVFFTIFRSPSRENKYKWIGPISDDSIYFYKRKGDPRNFNTIEDVRNKKISAPMGGFVYRSLVEQGFKSIEKAPSWSGQIKMVLSGRADLLVCLTPIGLAHYMNKENIKFDQLVKTPVKLIEFPLYISGSKEIDDEIIMEWQQKLDEMKSSGRYTQIYNKYLLEQRSD